MALAARRCHYSLNLLDINLLIRVTVPILQGHSGVKGIVSDAVTGRPVSNAVIHVKNITRVNKGGVRR